MTRRTNYYPVGGGLNVTAPSMKLAPGELITCQNYEPDRLGNYRRIDGYERYDGQPSPSDASYWALPYDAGSVEPSVGDKIMGDTSGTTGILIAVTLDSGTWGGGDAAGDLIVYAQAGTFINDEPLVNLGPYASASGFSAGFSNGFN